MGGNKSSQNNNNLPSGRNKMAPGGLKTMLCFSAATTFNVMPGAHGLLRVMMETKKKKSASSNKFAAARENQYLKMLGDVSTSVQDLRTQLSQHATAIGSMQTKEVHQQKQIDYLTGHLNQLKRSIDGLAFGDAEKCAAEIMNPTSGSHFAVYTWNRAPHTSSPEPLEPGLPLEKRLKAEETNLWHERYDLYPGDTKTVRAFDGQSKQCDTFRIFVVRQNSRNIFTRKYSDKMMQLENGKSYVIMAPNEVMLQGEMALRQQTSGGAITPSTAVPSGSASVASDTEDDAAAPDAYQALRGATTPFDDDQMPMPSAPPGAPTPIPSGPPENR
ncbi:unnamed protein product [Amoebophrya sp. A120]|nr:unnamed protein product [Amoebophrya sp. A120]|eukprot:GSA120T00000215001.1